MEWSLIELYESFESKAFRNDIDKIKEYAGLLETYTDKALIHDDKIATRMLDFIKYNEEVTTLITKTQAFASLTSATDANNSDAIFYVNQIQELATLFVKPWVKFQMYVKSCDNLEEIINSNAGLKVFEFFLKETKTKAKYLLSEKEEILISKMNMTGAKAWENLQNKVSSTLMIDVEINQEMKSLPLPAVRNLAYHKDAVVRKQAYEAEMKAYEVIETASSAALNGIKGEVLTLSQWRGYESPLDETLVKSRMDREILDAMLVAIRKALPSFHKYYQHKATLLKHRNGLPFYDLFAPITETSTTYTYAQAMDFVIKQFRTFSDELADFTQHAYDNKWLDVTPRAGKRGGAFCSNIHPIKQSRVLSNFDGSFSNLTTLAHELGHAYHGHQLKDESILNSRYPMPIAETASILCESIVVHAAIKEANTSEKIAILEASISDAGQVIVDILSRFIFESSLFEKRSEGVVSIDQLKKLMILAQKEAYGNGLDHDQLHPYMWLNKPHYYSAALNFYNFPYAFGLLFAKGLYAQYLLEGEPFVSKYNQLLQATGKATIKDVALMAEVDITKPEFFEQSLSLIENEINQFIELTSQGFE
jgi:pepF/M3 family oligoendopeptidase